MEFRTVLYILFALWVAKIATLPLHGYCFACLLGVYAEGVFMMNRR